MCQCRIIRLVFSKNNQRTFQFLESGRTDNNTTEPELLFDRRTFMEPQSWKQWMASLKCGGNELEKKEAQKRMT